MLTEKQLKILGLMQELENTMCDLYLIFEDQFPRHNDLWHTLAEEEREHANAVVDLYNLIKEGESHFDPGRIKSDAIQSIIDYVKNVCEDAGKGRFAAMQALEMTCDLEGSLIARDTFRQFDVSEKFGAMLGYLRSSSENHADMIKDELRKIRKDQKVAD
jgi:hypothetical protein